MHSVDHDLIIRNIIERMTDAELDTFLQDNARVFNGLTVFPPFAWTIKLMREDRKNQIIFTS